MIHRHRRKPFLEDRDAIDALVALQMLEDQEHAQEQEFFRITGEMQQFGCSEQDLEHILPDLLKTKREQALYDALITVAKRSRPAAGFHIATRDHKKIAHEFRDHC